MGRVWFLTLALALNCARADTFLIKSTDGGRTWTDIDPGPPHHRLLQLKLAAGGSRIYALTQTLNDGYRLAVSSDGGQSWEERLPVRFNVLGMAVDPADPETVYIARGDLEPMPLLLGLLTSGWVAWRPNPITLLRSTDGGRTAVEIPTNVGWDFPGEQFCDFVVHPSSPSTLYIVPGCGDDWLGDSGFSSLLKSVDGGRRWTPVPSLPCCTAGAVLLHPAALSTLWVVQGGALLESNDGGASWSPKLDRVGGAALHPGNPSVLVASRFDGSVWKSADGAETWEFLGDPGGGFGPAGIFHDAANPEVIYVSALGQRTAGSSVPWFHRSEDGGASWTAVPLLEGDPGLFSLLPGPKEPAVLFAAAYRLDSVDRDPGWTSFRHLPRLGGSQAFVLNAAGGRRIAPGSLVSIVGADLAAGTGSAATGPMPDSLLGTAVLFNGRPAPLFAVSPREVRAQVPFGLGEGPVTVEVHRGGVPLAARQAVTLFPVAPVALAGPLHAADRRPVTRDDPARPGQSVVLLFAGLGELRPSVLAGALPPAPLPETAAPFGSDLWPVLWSGAADGRVGVYQMILQVPAALAPGPYSVRVLSFWSQNTRYLGFQSALQSDAVVVEVR